MVAGDVWLPAADRGVEAYLRGRAMPGALIRPIRAIAWELRTAWARGLRVTLTIDGETRRVEGHVTTVSPTNAFAVVADLHVPLTHVLAVHRPSRLGDSTYREGEAWAGKIPPGARRDPRQLELPGLDSFA